MLQINVSQQLKAPIGSKRVYQVDEKVDIAGSDCLVQGEIELVRADRSILATGTLQTEIELTCSRCLSLFGYPLTIHFEEEYFPTIDVFSGAPLPQSDEPDSFTIDEHNILDLTEAIRQYALLAIPIKPLCAEDCAGLCPTCGANLNEVSCSCPPKAADPRWAELKKLTLTGQQTPVKEEKGTR